MNAHQIATQLSPVAKSALIAAGTNRQGATVAALLCCREELAGRKLIGPGNGLTRLGTIVRQIVVTQREDEMFA